jgi:hypothetical protein
MISFLPQGGEPGDGDVARKECKARSILNKFKEMETRVLNGEPEEGKQAA